MCRGSDTYTKPMVLIFGPQHQYINVPIRAWRGKVSVRQRDETKNERDEAVRERETQTLALKPGAPTREKKKDEKKNPKTSSCTPEASALVAQV